MFELGPAYQGAGKAQLGKQQHVFEGTNDALPL